MLEKKIILFNGPPRSGKDTAASYLYDLLQNQDKDPHILRMSQPIKAAFQGMLNLKHGGYECLHEYEETKEEPIPIFSAKKGTSYRQWQIDFSEKFMKPLYGDNIFASIFIQEVETLDCDVVLVPDCGFQVEYDLLAETYGEENILVVQLSRKGKDFSNDSRSYLTDIPANCLWCIHNDESIEDFHATLRMVLKNMIEGGLL
jgi:hypothetical protein